MKWIVPFLLAMTVGIGTASATVEIGSLRIIISKEGPRAIIEEHMLLTSDEPEGEQVEQFAIGLPAGAIAVQPIPAEDRFIKIENTKALYTGPVSRNGRSVAVQFVLPIKKGVVHFNQEMGHPISQFQVMSTWTINNTKLKVAGLGEATPFDSSGMTVLGIAGPRQSSGRIEVALSGLSVPGSALMKGLTFTSCIAILLLGLLLFVKTRLKNE